MAESDDAALLEHLSSTTGLDATRARRVVEDVLAYYGEDVEAFVRRRHGELARLGRKNKDIYPQLLDEIGDRRFAISGMTERQVRRLIYG